MCPARGWVDANAGGNTTAVVDADDDGDGDSDADGREEGEERGEREVADGGSRSREAEKICEEGLWAATKEDCERALTGSGAV